MILLPNTKTDLRRDYLGTPNTCSASIGKQSVVIGKIMLAKSRYKTFHWLTWKPTNRGEPITGSTGWTNKNRRKREALQSGYSLMVRSACLRMPAYVHQTEPWDGK